MKRCPECRRDYHDDTLSYCLADGSELVYGLEEDEPATALLSALEGRRSGGTFDAEIAELSERTPAIYALHQSGGDEVKDTSATFDNRLILAPMMLVLIVLGGFLGYRYFAQAKQIESIAVMPFVNDSGNPENEYLSDGMTETLISSLSQIGGLNVKARSSVFRYKGKEADAR